MKQWLYKNAFCSWGLMDPTRARITGVAVAGSSLRVRHTLDTSLAQRHIHVWGLLKVIFLFKTPNKKITFWVPNLTHSAPSVLRFEVTLLWFGPPTYKLIHLMLLPHIYLFISLFESCDRPCRRLPHSAGIVVCCCCPRWPPPGRSASNLPDRRRIQCSEMLNKFMVTEIWLEQQAGSFRMLSLFWSGYVRTSAFSTTTWTSTSLL